MSELVLLDDSWELRQDDSVVWSGDYPLVEDDDFIEKTANKLGDWDFVSKPYTKNDKRNS